MYLLAHFMYFKLVYTNIIRNHEIAPCLEIFSVCIYAHVHKTIIVCQIICMHKQLPTLMQQRYHAKHGMVQMDQGSKSALIPGQ